MTELGAWQDAIRGSMRAVLGPFPPAAALRTRLLNQVWADGLMAERITFESEPGITVPGLFIMPEEWHKPVPFVVYAGEWGKGQGTRGRDGGAPGAGWLRGAGD